MREAPSSIPNLLWSFNEYFKLTTPVHPYTTRQSCSGSLFEASVNTTQYGFRFLNSLVLAWNSPSANITNLQSLKLFCKALKISMLNCYSN